MSISMSSLGEHMQHKVEAFCLRQGSIPCRRLLIALSGGADSVTLLHIMRALQPKFGYTLSAMHVNHMIRGDEAKRDERFCRTLCDSMGIDLHCVSLDIPALAKAERMGLEECARHHRYAALIEYANAIGADRIATAHTATDQIETVLMQLIRGSATAGGIRPIRGRLIRPLLEVTREEIITYITENDLSFVEDSSNIDDRYTRNYVRHTIIPAIKAINPKAEDAFGRFAALRRSECDFLDSEAIRQLNGGSELCVDRSETTDASCSPVCLPVFEELASLQALHPVLRAHAIALLCEKGGITGLSHAHFTAMDELIVKGRSGASLSLPADTVCRIENGRFCLLAAADACAGAGAPNEIEPFTLQMGENVLPDGSILFAYSEMNERIEKYIKEKQNIYKLFINAALDFGKIGKAVLIRSRQPGDRILCGDMHRNVKKCFCDRHIPVEKRLLQPILCDDSGILWIPSIDMLRDGVSADDTDGNHTLRLIYMSEQCE